LADARLVTTEQDSAEVAHEALIREWGTLRKWLDEDRESLRLHRHLTESTGEWQRRGKEASELYRGARLKQLQDWLKEHGDALSPLEREFVRASENVKKREQMQWLGVAVVSVVLLLMVVLGVTGQLNRFIYQPLNVTEEDWVTIPAGVFQMGDEDTGIYPVNVDKFEIGRYEVTNRQYAQCMKAGICVGSAIAESKDLHPVMNVTWYDAVAYCEWVGGRLPTEAEWEKAARGTDGRIYPWGENIDCSLANYWGKDGVCVGDTTPIGSYPDGVSPYGAYDMAGNVWEWTSSLYMGYPYDATDGREGLTSTDDRVLRGGSWSSNDYYARSAFRDVSGPSYTSVNVGFRCARSLP